jgi:hypothetical protein
MRPLPGNSSQGRLIGRSRRIGQAPISRLVPIPHIELPTRYIPGVWTAGLDHLLSKPKIHVDGMQEKTQ